VLIEVAVVTVKVVIATTVLKQRFMIDFLRLRTESVGMLV
jgi:hypothetical protein